MIDGGYILKARCIAQSKISECSPAVREIWDYLLMNANYKKEKELSRGQIFTSILKIREGLAWKSGFRSQMYTPKQVRDALKKLIALNMIFVKASHEGTLITICNYVKFQNPKNYRFPKAKDLQRKNAANPLDSAQVTMEVTMEDDMEVTPPTTATYCNNSEKKRFFSTEVTPKGKPEVTTEVTPQVPPYNDINIIKNFKKERRSNSKLNLFTNYLLKKIASENLKHCEEMLIAFLNYRMTMTPERQFKTTYGISGLIRHTLDCEKKGLNPNDCLKYAMESEWLIPKYEYFKKTPIMANKKASTVFGKKTINTFQAGQKWLERKTKGNLADEN